MSRLPLPAALMTIAVLATAPAATAKEITAMKICGADRCAQVKRSTAQRLHDTGGLGGAAMSTAVGRAPYYRVIATIGEGTDDSAGHFALAYAPRLKAVLPLDAYPPAEWTRLSDEVAKLLDRLARPYRAAAGQAPLAPTRPKGRPFRRESGSHGRRPTRRTTGDCRRSSPACPRCWSSGWCCRTARLSRAGALELDPHVGAAGGPVRGAGAAAMRLGDGLDDREPEPGAAARSRARPRA